MDIMHDRSIAAGAEARRDFQMTSESDLISEFTDSEFEGTELDPYGQVGISGDTEAIYIDLIGSKDKRLRRREQ
jgi:hypothetical protein